MPKLTKRLTESLARKLDLPKEGYQIYLCADEPGLGCRVSSNGDRAWVLERRLDGKTVRRTLGKAAGAGAISRDAALKLKIAISSELQQGIDRVTQKRVTAKQVKEEAVTLADALQQYVNTKRRAKDGLPLKERTKSDYLAMVTTGKTFFNGSRAQDGELYPLANKSIYKITAEDIREVHAIAMQRSERRAAYCMQVLRAVLNWYGVKVPNSPLGKDVPGKDRIVIAQARSRGLAIPPERIGAWWTAANEAGNSIGGSREAADFLRFVLLTGIRPGEGKGSQFADGILVRDVDIDSARILLRDTKNRKDHTILLSRQALEIVARNVRRKKKSDKVFSVGDPQKTLKAINEAAGIHVTIQGLRKTFASVSDELNPGYTTKRLVNHTDAKDVTGAHYVQKGESALRLGWQTVADFIEAQAGNDSPRRGNVINFSGSSAMA